MRAWLAILLAGCAVQAPATDVAVFPQPQDLTTELVAGGLDRPVAVAFVPGIDNLMWAIEKGGTAHIIWDGIVVRPASLDISGTIAVEDWEQGLLDIEFLDGPDGVRAFARITPPSTNGTFPESVAIVEIPYDPETFLLDGANLTTLLTIPKPKAQHNGGSLVFGTDGMLYVGMGEGGISDHARNHTNLLGTILRLDVSEPGGYSVPADNPFVGQEGHRPEIWQYGLRNPWKMAVDRVTGDLWVADVGGGLAEEIDRIPPDAAGLDYGWGIMEGDLIRVDRGVDTSLYEPPVHAYERGDDGFPRGWRDEDRYRCAIIGGFVYRGQALPGLVGSYVFGDLCAGAVYALENGTWQERFLVESHSGVSAIEEDPDGEILIVNHDMGTVRRIVAA